MSQHETILADLNRYTTATRLVIILMDDAIKHTCTFGHYRDVISKSRTIHRHLFSSLSPFRSPIKEKGKQGRMKGLTRAQWVNLNRNNRPVLASQYSVLWEKTGPILPPLVVRQRGREAGRRNTGGFRNFETSLQVKLFGILFCLISLQFYYSIKIAFSRLLSS